MTTTIIEMVIGFTCGVVFALGIGGVTQNVMTSRAASIACIVASLLGMAGLSVYRHMASGQEERRYSVSIEVPPVQKATPIPPPAAPGATLRTVPAPGAAAQVP